MIQEEKELLLRDLSSRLPYGVKVNYERPDNGQHYIDTLEGIDEVYFCEEKNSIVVASVGGIGVYIDVCKPYLRSMSSLTEEEIKELKTLCSIYIPTDSPTIGFEDYGILVFTHHLTNNTYSFKLNISVIDWLNKKMFAYRTINGKDMFELGLALEAPKGMYNTKEK